MDNGQVFNLQGRSFKTNKEQQHKKKNKVEKKRKKKNINMTDKTSRTSKAYRNKAKLNQNAPKKNQQ